MLSKSVIVAAVLSAAPALATNQLNAYWVSHLHYHP